MSDDREFLRRFEAAEITPSEWVHAAHVRVAYLLLRESTFPEAVRRMRRGIRRLHFEHGAEDSENSGYHETWTLAWARLVAAAITPADDRTPFDAFVAAHPELLERDRALLHYSRERLLSARARREFVLPDRRPLPPAISRRRAPVVAPFGVPDPGAALPIRVVG